MAKEKPRVVLDTNLFINATFARDSASARIIKMVQAGGLEALVSAAIEREYDQQLSPLYIQRQWRGSAQAIAASIAAVREQATRIKPDVHITESSDPADNKFIECAISGSAAYIISRDDDLLSLKRSHGIPILTPGRFWRQVGQS